MTDVIGLGFVHGAGLGGWIWADLAAALDVPHVSTDLPAREGEPAERMNLRLDDYADTVLAQLDGLQAERVVLVAHSLGGVVGLQVAHRLGDRLAGFVGVSAAIPKDGGSLVSALPMPKRLVVGALMRVLGTKAPESAIRRGLCNDLSSEQADEVVRRFAPESRAVYFSRTDAAVPEVPRLYVRLTDDKEFDGRMQDTMAANLRADVRELDSGHLPMLSKPKELARILNEFCTTLS